MPADRGPLPEPGVGPRVRVYTRVGCHLCDDALAVVREVCTEGGWEAVDVDADPRLRAEYSDHVPVTVVDGRIVGRWFLSPETLRDALAR